MILSYLRHTPTGKTGGFTPYGKLLLCCVAVSRDYINHLSGASVVQEQTTENDQALVAVVFVLTGIVFALDLLTPSDIVAWSLYLVPLGISRWSYIKHLTVGLAILCTSLIICAHFYNPGPTQDVAIINRVFGIVMVWVSTFFLKVERM